MTAIGWTDATWNPVTGCSAVSEGCTNCYAAKMTKRQESMGTPEYQGLMNEHHFNGKVKCHEHRLDIPLRWHKPRMVFVNSMSDLFHEGVPFEFIDKVFAVMAWCPQHTFQILTKRSERMAAYLSENHREYLVGTALGNMLDGDWIWNEGKKLRTAIEQRICDLYGVGVDDYEPVDIWPLNNVWLGTSCEDQATLDERVPHLLKCPAAVRFLSLEPLLGPINIDLYAKYTTADDVAVKASQIPVTEGSRLPEWRSAIHWVIVGCESGPKRRPCRWEWIQSIVRQCQDAGVPVFVKQLADRRDGLGKIHKHTPGDAWPEFAPEWARVQEFPN